MNDKHYKKGAPQGKGGQFAPKRESSITCVPEITSLGKPRVFYNDLSKKVRNAIEREYVNNHKDLLSRIDYLKDNFDTFKIHTGERDMLRQKWINDEFNEQEKEGPKRRNRRATLIIGLPASGKSTIANPLSKKMGAFIVDADNFKKRIPEFQKDKEMVSAVHHESVSLADNFMNELSDSGYNMIIGKVGGDFDSVKYILDDLGKKGYKIDVILNDIPFDIAMERGINRYDRKETDRFVPFFVLKQADKKVFYTFDQILDHNSVIGGRVYSNDVPKGTSPKLLKKFKK